MTDMREGLAFALWENDAARAAPNVARNRNPDAFLAEADATRNHWLHHADAVIATLPELVKPLEWTEFLPGEIFKSGDYTVRLDSWHHKQKLIGTCLSPDAAKVAANTHHRAQIMAAFGLPKQEGSE